MRVFNFLNSTYLGDAVYARVEFGQIVLATGDGGPMPTNVIVLEPEVYEALKAFVDRDDTP